jgi:Skp family chaperone for outer membrane proteins
MKHLLVAVAMWSACGVVSAAQAPAQPASAAQKAPPVNAPPPKPFPEGSKIAFIIPQRIIAESELGKALATKINALRSQKLAELTAKNKELEAAQQKLAGGSLLSEEARAAAQKGVDRIQLELQRAQQDAEAAVQDLQQQVNGELERAITPLLEQVAIDKGIHLLLRADTGAVAWADPALDLTGEIIKRLDAATPKPPKAP